MSNIVVVYHSGYGHTGALAEAVAKGAKSVPGANVALVTLAMQHGMVWVGLGLAPGFNHSKGSIEDLNRLGASIGAMGQSNADQGVEGTAASDFRTMEALGKRVAEAAVRW